MRLWLVLLALVISAAWYWSATVSSAHRQIESIYLELETIKQQCIADDATYDSLFRRLNKDTRSRDTTALNMLDDLSYRSVMREDAVRRISVAADSLCLYGGGWGSSSGEVQ